MVPVFYLALGLTAMNLMRSNTLQEPLEGMGSEIGDFDSNKSKSLRSAPYF
jgi:hypothetical protein